MPYYMGDYYRGDPGIGSFFRKALSFGASFIPGIGGGISRAISGAGARALPAAAGVATTGIVRRAGTMMGHGAASVGRIISKHPVLSAAGAAGAIGALGGFEGERMVAGGAGGAPRGFHRCKHPGRCKSEFVRNRRMNVCNPRALRRSLRRAHGFVKLAMRTIHLVHPKKKGRFGGFKKRVSRKV